MSFHSNFQPTPFDANADFQSEFQYPAKINHPELELDMPAVTQQAEYYLKRGNKHYNSFLTKATKQELDLAIDCYRRALETNPNLPEGYVKLASALYDKGEVTLETAIQYCQHALQLNPKHAEANLFLGYFLRQSGNLDGAIAAFAMAIQKAPFFKSAKPRLAYGRVLLQKANHNPQLGFAAKLNWMLQGLGQFATGLMLIPAELTIVETLKSALLTDSKIYSVLNLAKAASFLRLYPVSQAIYQAAIKSMPTEAVFHHCQGDNYLRLGQADNAISAYQKAVELDPDNALLGKKLAKLYQKGQDSAKAVESLEKVVENNHDDFEAVYSLAQMYTDRNDYMRALYYFKELSSQHQNNPYIHSNMAYVLFKLEDYDGAIKEYQAAVTHGDDPLWTATVAQTLGTIYHQVKGDVQQAIQMFQLAYQLDSSNLECVTQLADLYLEQGNLEAAIGAYQYILNFEPNNADCHTYIGYLLWQLDKNQEAIQYYLKAIQLEPENAIAYNNLGVIYLDEEQDPIRALEMFNQALDLKPEYTLACFNVGRAQEDMGLITEAAKTYSNAIALNAEVPELTDQEILERLDRLFDV